MKEPILRARALTKTFYEPEQIEILKGIDLDIYAGESIAITGRSGEGKTTLLHILGTLESFCSGELSIDGKEIKSQNGPLFRNQHIGFVFQSYNLLDDFSALENVLMPARIGRLPISTSHGLELLRQVNMEQRAHFPAKLLSGGERQRIAIARALCNDPQLIFADEPSGNLDQAHADQIRDLLFHLVKNHRKTLLLVTHDADLSSRCDRRFTLSQGKLFENT
jgi:lipoprotein-releasing system ATP-binding protein